MNEEILRKIAQEEIQKQIMENLDSSIIFTYINNLEKQLEQEKEEREIAEENHKVLSLDLGDALKELGLPEDTIIADELVLEINNRYISKDKIKAKIEEYDKMIKATYRELTHQADVRRDVCLEIKSKLQELLEE